MGNDEAMKYVELFRHTDNDGDRLTPAGVSAAEAIGRERLTPPYDAFVSSGAARATQMLKILQAATGPDDLPIVEDPGFRSSVEDRWRDAAKAAGKGADLEKIRAIDPDLVDKESLLLAGALKRVIDRLPAGGRALVVGHSPTNEAAVLGLAAIVVPPLGKGEGIRVIETDGRYRVEPLQ
jgi:broad specificity phosphatase PhoE